jgi:hypothetical protein
VTYGTVSARLFLRSGVRRASIKRLRITEVSSVDRGANAHATVVLRKQYEAEHPDYPKWEPEKYQKEQEMRKADHPFEHIEHLTDQVRKGEIGTGVAEMRGKAWHDSHAFDAYRKDERGKVLSDHQQWQHFKKFHPVGKAFSEVCANGLRDTTEEMEKELGLKSDLDAAHERQRELGSGHHGRNERQVTKQTVSSICIDEINKMAGALVEKAKREKGITISFQKAFEVIINGTEKGKRLASLEKFLRIGV